MSDHAFRMDSIASQWSVSVERQGHFLVSRQTDGSLKEWKVLPPLRYITPLPERPKIIKFGAIELRQYRRRLLFFKGDQLLWDIDTGRFAGTPTLTVSNDGKVIQLENARFPGTLIPANLTLAISEEAGRWRMWLSFPWGGFQAEVDLERWLSYQEVAASNLLLAGMVCAVGAGGVSVVDNNEATFSPAWVFSLQGAATFVGLGTHLEAETLTLGLLPPQVLPLDKGTDGHMTLLSLGNAYEIPWFNLSLQGIGQASWRTRSSDPVYSALQVTAWEPAPPRDVAVEPTFADAGRIVAAISQYEPAPTLELQAGGGLKGENAEPWAIPLLRPGYFAVYHRDGKVLEHTLLATLRTDEQWLHSNHVSLRLGEPRYPLLSLSWDDSRTRCGHPALLLNKEYGLRYQLQFSMVRADNLTAEPMGYPASANAIVALGSHEPTLTEQDIALVRLTGAEPAKIVFPSNWSAKFQRHQDLLWLEFHFSRIRLVAQGTDLPRLERLQLAPIQQPIVVIKFPPQSIAEACSRENADGMDDSQSLPLASVAAEPSRLAWRLTRNCTLNAQLLLGWLTDPNSHGVALVSLSPSLAASALAPPTLLKPPTAQETAIEAPVRLFLSPDQNGIWEGSRTPIEHTHQTELWHVRLRDKRGVTPVVKAIWAEDYPDHSVELPLTCAALNKVDRHDIVEKSTKDLPINSNKLMLSSLGAWLDLKGEWKEGLNTCDPNDSNLESWHHIATLGRDHFVKIVRRGYLFPFGHKAAYIKITERKFINKPMGYREARLIQRTFIVVRERKRSFPLPLMVPAPNSPPAPHAEQLRRSFPFEQVEILIEQTPWIDPPGDEKLFWPTLSNSDYRFPIRATDREGQTVEFMAPLCFVGSCPAKSAVNAIIGAFNQDKKRNSYALLNQTLAFAPGSSRLEVSHLTVSAAYAGDMPVTGDTDPKRSFNPSMAYLNSGKLAFTPASVVLPVLRQLGGVTAPQPFCYAAAYSEYGFGGNNKGELFFRADAAFDLAFGKDNKPDKIGALATPNIKIGGISRKIGPVGINEAVSNSLETIRVGTFDPASYFSDVLKAKLLGGVKLKDILKTTVGDLGTAPQWVTSQEGQDTVYRLQWNTLLQEKGIFIHNLPDPPALGECRLDLVVENRVKSGSDISSKMTAELQHFGISLAGVLIINFEKFIYQVVPGSKPLIHLALKEKGGITFGGALEFINKIEECLSSSLGHFTDPPYINVNTDGITAGYSLPIPNIAVGAFALQNLALSAGITLPFTGEAMRARFALSERHAPFMVTVSLFAGEGFVALAVGPDGIETVEVSLGFGGSIQLNLGVASGGVSIMGGIYIEYSDKDKASLLSGYLRINGAMEVLGIACVSVSYYLALNYETNRKVAWGEASASLKVEVAFFSKSVTVSVRREFARGSEDLSFAALMSPQDWSSYQQAFCEEL